MFKKFFHQDNIHIGITAVLLSEALCAAVLYLVTIIIGRLSTQKTPRSSR